MEKNILLAVDNSRHSKLALDYALQMSNVITNLRFTLLHIQPMVSLILQGEAKMNVTARKQLTKITNTNHQIAQDLLDTYRRDLENKGIEADRITTLNRPRYLGCAKDIIDIAQAGYYDAIVVGRRGISGIVKLYSGSVTTEILEQSQVIPVWLVDGEPGSGEMLIAVDGSEASLRAVDHVSFMLAGNSMSKITLLHVKSSARNYCEIDPEEPVDNELEEIVVKADKTCIEKFYHQAMQKFKQAGIDDDRIQFKTIPGSRLIGKSIHDFVKDENFSTIIVGRRGLEKSFFMGSVSRHMINKISNRALWMIP